MKTQQFQFKRQKVAALLLTGSILAATAGLIWVDASLSQANREAGSANADVAGYDSELSPESHLNAVKGGKAGGVVGSNR